MSDVKAIITDIEGTTSSISFVKDTLFPFARRRLADYVAEQGATPTVKAILDEARAALGTPSATDPEVAAAMIRWIDEDRKITPLKTLQGLIWADGYATGSLVGHVYPDAVEGLRRWHTRGIALYVYSSGSIAAQRLIYGHTRFGDLTPLFSGYFDTTTGGKLETASYRRITEAIGQPAPALLFLSDNVGELDAARASGLQTICLDRGEAVIPPTNPHRTVSSFAEIIP